ncbi:MULTISPECIES: polynucleotide adenylyltransferase [unclassified Modicisalibacter]|uniref:polynucleotide adenylyltransferase n=1 Tax=unclassified Modicisalibacter TaxID=2679913 RepID=UPI001CCB420B|nr:MULTISPECIES: polynucleotide adenylyltransferase [unclassified Modicisalibacter]MBZ9559339.1 polynucleotide adenylyltransferase [Modicisalibacter sp. R2A 31.J]MBZ9576496.1 polynucleotide adenylyltransferase [Modicisalibacter sp. MOD 31.J]
MSRDRRLAGLEVYRVGGAVRDARLGWPVVDQDWVVVGATPEAMTRRGFKPVGRDFPVFLHPETHEEYALARTERKQGHGYTGFVVHADPSVTLEEDLERRDLTINAMAESREGALIDPFHGRDDLEARRLRHVSPAFVEDPLRVLRTARFLARYRGLGFQVADETQALMRRLAESGELAHLVAERVWTETEKALGEPCPQAYFACLDACGALMVLMPELCADLETALARLDRLPDTEAGMPAQWRWARLCEHLDDGEREALQARLKVPNAYTDLARQVALTRRLWGAAATPSALTAERLRSWFDGIDAWRRSERVAPLLALLERENATLAACAERAWRAAAAVSPRALLDEGLRGGELGAELARRRQGAIAGALEASEG